MAHQHYLKNIFIPELGNPYRGKVRDIYEMNNTLTLVASDRISIFDRILNEPIRDKGRILTNLSLFWFEKTKDIVPNHVINQPDPNVIVVKKCKPLLVEMVVRSYMIGSLWRDYEKGQRNKCGIPLPEGLERNDPLPFPIVTPSTKSSEGHDEDITKDELIQTGIVTASQWSQLETLSLKLFERGRDTLKQKGILLLDTKYEFGLDESNNIVLIDEIHTPDSSRFWFQKDAEQKEKRFPDKEFAREWAMSQGFMGNGPLPHVPDEIRNRIREGYKEIYETITGQKLTEITSCVPSRVIRNLKDANMIKGYFTLIITDENGNKKDIELMKKILSKDNIPTRILNLTDHKISQQRIEEISRYNASLEPVVCIVSTENPQALSYINSADLQWPVVTYPLNTDENGANPLSTNLINQTQLPCLVAANPSNAAIGAIRILKTMELSL